MPAARRNFSALICTALPTPTEPNEIDPGLALASAMKSCTVFQRRVTGTIITLALEPIISAEARSLVGSSWIDRRRDRQRRGLGKNAVAVIGLHHHGGAERAAGAGAIFDHDGLAEFR